MIDVDIFSSVAARQPENDAYPARHALIDDSEADDTRNVSLLRHFEPIIRFTRGEQFFPMDAAPYVEACSLWLQSPRHPPVCLVPHQQMTLEQLGQLPNQLPNMMPQTDGVYFLRFTKPLSTLEMTTELVRHWQAEREEDNVFRAGRGRLARVGYLSRFVDALFSLSLLTRGRVPGDAAAVAANHYRALRENREEYCYHGRVVQQGDWFILQYWFFYLYNNWRTRFFGANDHEGDWEMICIYLSREAVEKAERIDDGTLKPEWVAYASHDFHGDDLRRRWDDPEVKKVGSHPVVYAGAGSHGAYYSPGEYITELVLPFMRPLVQLSAWIQGFWHNRLRQYAGDELHGRRTPVSNIFYVPFVDYARGDGLAVGPGQLRTWSAPRLLTPTPAWVLNYRGLWGLYTHDPFAGEDAPAGPMYNRDGTVRRAWYDPVGWAGLDKVVPFDQALSTVLAEQAATRERCAQLRITIQEKSEQLVGAGTQLAAIRGSSDLGHMIEARQKRVKELSAELNKLRANLAEDELLLGALESHVQRIQSGDRGPLRTHIQRGHQPASDIELRMSRLAEIWAATSIGILLLSVVWLAYYAPEYLMNGVLAIVYVTLIIEASFRQRLASFVTGTTVFLAFVALAILVYEYVWESMLLAVLVAGTYILWENLRELWT